MVRYGFMLANAMTKFFLDRRTATKCGTESMEVLEQTDLMGEC